MAMWKGKAKKYLPRKCAKCNSKENLEVHHILPKCMYPDKRGSLHNLVYLCAKCHDEYHDEYLKKRIELCNPDTFYAWLRDEIHPSLLDIEFKDDGTERTLERAMRKLMEQAAKERGKWLE